MQDIRLNDPELNYIKLLEEISVEQKFDATFVDIEEKSHCGKISHNRVFPTLVCSNVYFLFVWELPGDFQVLLPLSLTPIAVLYGNGSCYEEARKQAALNALNYLKQMTKKPAVVQQSPAPDSSSSEKMEQQEIPVEAVVSPPIHHGWFNALIIHWNDGIVSQIRLTFVCTASTRKQSKLILFLFSFPYFVSLFPLFWSKIGS